MRVITNLIGRLKCVSPGALGRSADILSGITKWEKRKTQLELLTWTPTNTPDLEFSMGHIRGLCAETVAFAFGRRIIDFEGFPVFPNDLYCPKDQRITKEITFRGYRISLIFTSLKYCHPATIVGQTYDVVTNVGLVVTEITSEKVVHQEDNLRNAGIYRLKLGEETLYFGDASLLRSLLKQQNQDIALYYAENKTPIPMNRKFKVFLIAPDKSAQVLESGKQSAGISIQGKTYTFEFGLFVAGQDDSTSKTVNITWPHYFFKIKRPGHEPEFPVNALAKYVYRLDINGQQVFVYAEPL